MAYISGSVGANGKNLKTDVQTVQTLLNRVPPDKGGHLNAHPIFWNRSIAAVVFCQQRPSTFNGARDPKVAKHAEANY